MSQMLNKKDQITLDKMFSELKSIGYRIDDTYYFTNYKGDYKNALPILLKYLKEIGDPVQKEGVSQNFPLNFFS